MRNMLHMKETRVESKNTCSKCDELYVIVLCPQLLNDYRVYVSIGSRLRQSCSRSPLNTCDLLICLPNCGMLSG